MKPFLQFLTDSLKDRQQFKLNAKKIGDDLVIYVETGNSKAHDITVPLEDLNRDEIDHIFWEKLQLNDQAMKATLQHQVTDAPKNDDGENADGGKKNPPSANKDSSKSKAGAKKQPAKKDPVKKEDKKGRGKKGKENPKPKVEEEVDQEKTEQTQEPVKTDDSNDFVQSAAPGEENQTASPDPEKETPAPAIEEGQDGPSKKDLFDHFMEEGKRLFGDRMYAASEEEYAKALELFPDDEKAIKAHTTAVKWAKAVADMNKKK